MVPVQAQPNYFSQLSPGRVSYDEVPHFPAGNSSSMGDLVQEALQEGTVGPKQLCLSARFNIQDPMC